MTLGTSPGAFSYAYFVTLFAPFVVGIRLFRVAHRMVGVFALLVDVARHVSFSDPLLSPPAASQCLSGTVHLKNGPFSTSRLALVGPLTIDAYSIANRTYKISSARIIFRINLRMTENPTIRVCPIDPVGVRIFTYVCCGLAISPTSSCVAWRTVRPTVCPLST